LQKRGNKEEGWNSQKQLKNEERERERESEREREREQYLCQYRHIQSIIGFFYEVIFHCFHIELKMAFKNLEQTTSETNIRSRLK
jgi:negative regulator of genetic competence, sporulation and motility